jgi:hypothetical protein
MDQAVRAADGASPTNETIKDQVSLRSKRRPSASAR